LEILLKTGFLSSLRFCLWLLTLLWIELGWGKKFLWLLLFNSEFKLCKNFWNSFWIFSCFMFFEELYLWFYFNSSNGIFSSRNTRKSSDRII